MGKQFINNINCIYISYIIIIFFINIYIIHFFFPFEYICIIYKNIIYIYLFISFNSIEYNLAKIVDEKISTPILYYDIKNEISYEKPVAAVYSKLKDGNERLTFFVSSNKSM